MAVYSHSVDISSNNPKTKENMMLNSLLHIPKTQGNFNCAGSFATILLSCLEDNGYQVKTLKKHSKFEDLLIVTKNGRTQSIIIGDESACKILKRLDSQKTVIS